MRSFMFTLTVVVTALMFTTGDAQALGRHRGHRGCGGGCGYGGCGWGGGCGGGCGMAAGGCGGCGGGMAYGGCGGGCGGCGGVAMAGDVIQPAAGPAYAMAQPANVGTIRLTVNVPEGAKLTIDGVATTSSAKQRVFESPAVPLGKTYQYTLKAEVSRNGQTRAVTQVVVVRPEQDNRVTLDLPTAAVAMLD